MSDEAARSIDLQTPLTFRDALRFPVQNSLARREILIGALWLLVPGVGWILNMGHRIAMVHNMQQGKPAWPAWRNYSSLLRHGSITFLGMLEYHAPSMIVGYFAWQTHSIVLHALAAILWVAATVAVPGFMSHYCVAFDASEVWNPRKALSRVFQGGALYWKAWGIVSGMLALSSAGLLAGGVGFLVTSVWFWQAAGFSFATVFTQKFELRALS